MTLRFGAKIPGPSVRMGGVEMDFNYGDYFKAAPSTGYETLIYDCMIGDATLFQRADNIEGGWRVVQPVLDAWAEDRATALPIYPAGSAGPSEADALLARDGRRWRPINGDDDGTIVMTPPRANEVEDFVGPGRCRWHPRHAGKGPDAARDGGCAGVARRRNRSLRSPAAGRRAVWQC